MKQIILILVLLISCGSLSAQNNSSRKKKNYTTQIKELETELREAYDSIVHLRDVLCRAYVLIAQKKELQEMDLLTKSQYSRNRLNYSMFDKRLFKTIDIRGCRRFEIFDESPQVLTAMPKDSYKIEKTERHSSVLEITDIERFWAITRYLVIMANWEFF